MPSTEVRTYNPDRIVLLVGGAQMQGYAEDQFVEIAPMSDRVVSKSGADGEVARAISTDRRHTVTITLQQTSPSNDILSGFAKADDLTCGGAAFPILVQDLCGRTMFAATSAWVSKAPSITFGREVSDRVWEITTGNPTIWFAGGNQ